MKKLYTLALVVMVFTVGHAQTINTIAGTGGGTGSRNEGGAAVDAAVPYPWATAVDDAGNIYFSDPFQSVVRKIDAAGVITTVAGTGVATFYGDGGNATSASLNTPYGLACDHLGNLYIADSKNNVVRKVDANGIIHTVAGNGVPAYYGDGGPTKLAALSNPMDIAVDGDGNLYISDAGNNAVRKVNAGDTITNVVNGFSSDLPTGGACGYTGTLWMPENARLSGITVDAAGNVYIADYWDNVIRKVTPSGSMRTIAGDPNVFNTGDGGPAIHAGLIGPRRIVVDNSGNIIFADSDNGRIRKINSAGIITTVAGGNYSSNIGDGGPAAAATLSTPVGISMTPSGDLIIADRGNHRIRKVNIATVAVQSVRKSSLSLEVYPNPARDELTITSDLKNEDSDVDIVVTNSTGYIILTTSAKSQNGKLNAHLLLGRNLANGLYFVELRAANALGTARFMLVR